MHKLWAFFPGCASSLNQKLDNKNGIESANPMRAYEKLAPQSGCPNRFSIIFGHSADDEYGQWTFFSFMLATRSFDRIFREISSE